ncbi:HTH-type transcriptional regulator GltC [Clostridioides difficile]|nr:LysR family transcriptional regulator [Clostridioides sp. ZZV14-6387]CZR97614.1 HTH-type transcriptional regulator GltC [Clostridioides difficile]CZS10419.1 HTH-type transcriptional regulator GltC [Clostridioides difficile]
MNLNHLHYFRVLAKVEHYTKAATQLSITQPSLSHAISALEKELGTFLFEKQGRNVRLTKYGKFFLTYVDKALGELERGEKKLREYTSISKGVVDLGFIYTLGAHFIPNIIGTFLEKESNKNISFSFGQGTTKKIIQGLKDEKFDLAFCSFVPNESNIDFTAILQEELVVIVPYSHPLASNDSVDLKDTENYPFIFFSEDSGIRPIIDNLFEKVNVKPQIICETEEDTAVAGLVSINYGIAVVPNIFALKYFNVKILSIANPIHERYIYLATMKNKYLTPAVSEFKNFVIDYSKTNNLIDIN